MFFLHSFPLALLLLLLIFFFIFHLPLLIQSSRTFFKENKQVSFIKLHLISKTALYFSFSKKNAVFRNIIIIPLSLLNANITQFIFIENTMLPNINFIRVCLSYRSEGEQIKACSCFECARDTLKQSVISLRAKSFINDHIISSPSHQNAKTIK